MRTVLIALLIAPLAGAISLESDIPTESVCGEPCGWIEPLIDIVIPEKPPCGGGRPILPGETPTDCLPLMADGESITLQGKFTMQWDAAEEPFYPIPPGEAITVSFSSVPNNMRFLDYSVTPATWQLTNEDVALGTQYHCLDTSDPNAVTFEYCYERDIEITITRDGDPRGQEIPRIENRNGIVSYMLKAETSETSDGRYLGSFTVEDIRFDSTSEMSTDEGKESPGIGFFAVAALAFVAFLRRK